jgi:hypothetical protein
MLQPIPMNRSSKVYWLLPWLQIVGAAVVVVLTALFSAVHSPLGQDISTGESPGFAWIGANIIACIGFALAYLIGVSWLQIKHQMRSASVGKILALLICTEAAGIALIPILLFFQQDNLLPPALTVLLVFLLLQASFSFRRSDQVEADRQSAVSQNYSTRTGLFLIFLFATGGAISFLGAGCRIRFCWIRTGSTP